MRTSSIRGLALRTAFGLAALTAALCLCSCAAYLLPRGGTRSLVATDGPERALERIAPLRKGGSRLLYLYERGSILQEMGRYVESNQVLAQADERYEDLYTKSLSREIFALGTSDELVPYRGPTFESTFAHYYRVMNFIRMGQTEDAVVECRRLNRELQRCRDQRDSSYTDDPFLQYLTGVVYRTARERDDADVSWRVARSAYRDLGLAYTVEAPPGLACDLAENARALGDLPEDEPRESCEATRRGDQGRVYLFLEYGNVRCKVERVLAFPIYRDEIGSDSDRLARDVAGRCDVGVDGARELVEIIHVALPALVETGPRADRGMVRVDAESTGSRVAPAVVGADIGALAQRSFDRDYDRILIRAVARSVSKCIAREAARVKHEKEKEGAEKVKGEEKEKEKEGWLSSFAGWLGPRLFSAAVSVFTVATERADIRCWSTLPDQILVARLDLPSGRHSLNIELSDPYGRQLGTWNVQDVDVVAGETRLVRHRLGQGVPFGHLPPP